MSAPPPIEVIAATERGTSQITRRIEFYEADGVTQWFPTGLTDELPRLVDGSVDVDYSRDERRTLDLTLLNEDKLLRPNPNDGLWYDKVIKVFRGIKYQASATPPSIAIVEKTSASNAAYQFKSLLQSVGFTRSDVQTAITKVDDLSAYDIIASYTGSAASAKSAMLKTHFDSGGSVVTISSANSTTELPFVATQTAAGTAISWGITPVAEDNPLSGKFASEAVTPTSTGVMPITLVGTAQRVAVWNNGVNPLFITGIIATNENGGRWFDLHIPSVGTTETLKLLKAGIDWVRNFQPYKSWETQMGEFCIDKIDEQNFPYQIKITGRDYTKRCLTSKFEKAATFDNGTPLRELIVAIAANAGITKMRVPTMDEVIASSISVDRGTSRWEILKKAADANGYEIYFDNEGYLTMRKFVDPSFGGITATFQTGLAGNLVSYSRSTNDSRLYNHICIYGDPSDTDEARLPYFGEAKNTDPNSPTRISRIGDRLYTFASTFFTSDAQAQALAEAWLKIHALESYELAFQSLYYAWLEVGEIVSVLDPDALPTDPTRFLLDTISFPLGLGPMGMSAKRVTYVGDPDSVPDEEEEAA